MYLYAGAYTLTDTHMFMDTHVFIDTQCRCVCRYTCAHIHMLRFISCTQIHIFTCTHVQGYLYTCICGHTCHIYLCMQVFVGIHIFTGTWMCSHVHRHTHAFRYTQDVSVCTQEHIYTQGGPPTPAGCLCVSTRVFAYTPAMCSGPRFSSQAHT